MNVSRNFLVFAFSFFVFQQAYAVFPEDLSNVVIHHVDVSEWPETSELNVTVGAGVINMPYDKATEWRSVTQPFCTRCNANPWVIVNFDGVWHAATFEWFRFGQTSKPTYVVNGDHIKTGPFGTTWKPKTGETYGFMVTGLARFDNGYTNVQERTNICMFTWGESDSCITESTAPVMAPIIDLLNAPTPPPAPMLSTPK